MFQMNVRTMLKTAAIICLASLWLPRADAQIPVQKIKEAAREAKDAVTDKDQEKAAPKAEAEPAAAAGGKIVFSTAPIDPDKPENLATSFKSGDYIYGLIQVEKTWRDLLGKGNKSATKIEVPIDMLIDGETVDFQYIHIEKPEAIDSKYLVFDVAPEPEKMTAYKTPGFTYAEGKGRRKIGPDTYTFNLAEMKAGKHTVRFQVRSYGDIFSAGEFTIEGEDYKFYAELREKVLQEAFAVATMPKAGMVNKELEDEMRRLLENAGWKDIRKLVIRDKDWWLDRASGGDSPIVSRHLDAAVAAKADDGSFFWCICTFHQHRRLDGSYGPLELTHTGDKKPILEENIDK